MTPRRRVSLLLGLLMALVPLAAAALEVHTEEDYVLPADATVDGDLFVNGVVVRIEGHVRGDLYVISTFADVGGAVDGDVIAIGRELGVRGPVGGNVRVGGGMLNVSAPVGRNVAAAVGVLRLGSGTRVGGSVLAWTWDAPLMVGPRAEVAGPIDYWSDGAARIADGARAGTAQRHDPPRIGLGPRASAAAQRAAGVLWLLWVLGTGLAAGVVSSMARGGGGGNGGAGAVNTLRRGVLTPALSERERGMTVVAYGLAGLVVPPVLLPVLALTIVGLPLALGLGALWLLGLWAAWLVAGAALGAVVAPRLPWPVGTVRAAVGGTLLLGLAASLPYVGALVAPVALVGGLGAMLEARWPARP